MAEKLKERICLKISFGLCSKEKNWSIKRYIHKYMYIDILIVDVHVLLCIVHDNMTLTRAPWNKRSVLLILQRQWFPLVCDLCQMTAKVSNKQQCWWVALTELSLTASTPILFERNKCLKYQFWLFPLIVFFALLNPSPPSPCLTATEKTKP